MCCGMEACTGLDYEHFMSNCLDIIRRCDGVLMLPGWIHSPGSRREHEFALAHNIPIFYSMIELAARKWSEDKCDE